MATIPSARILGFESIPGSIEPGMVANLVAVRENSLEEISRSRDIVLVVHDGRAREPLRP